jgi:hypothetical protein
MFSRRSGLRRLASTSPSARRCVHRSGDLRTVLSPALSALDRLLASHAAAPFPIAGNERAASAALHEAATLLSDEARAVDPHRAERMVVALHEVWPSLPAVQSLDDTSVEAHMRAVVVGACIRAFYQVPVGDGTLEYRRAAVSRLQTS